MAMPGCKGVFNSPRLDKEILALKKSPPSGISCYPKQESQKNVLSASIVGTSGSPYEKGVFQLEIIVTERYPFEPPRVRFVTPVYHPNVDAAGRICLDMLKMPPSGSWKPIFTIEGVLTTIQCLMTNPNPDDPLMPDIASQYKYNKEQFDKDAEAWTVKHARANSISNCVNSAVVNNVEVSISKRKSDGAATDDDSDEAKKRAKIESNLRLDFSRIDSKVCLYHRPLGRLSTGDDKWFKAQTSDADPNDRNRPVQDKKVTSRRNDELDNALRSLFG